MDVLSNDLGDPQITKRSTGHLKCSRRGILPGFSTGSNEIRHSIDAHATLLGHVGGLCPPDRSTAPCRHRQEVPESTHRPGTTPRTRRHSETELSGAGLWCFIEGVAPE